MRNVDERQHYSLSNFVYPGDGVIPQNVLTIYADPTVNFELKSASGDIIVTNEGIQVSKAVTYYNKTTDNGHNVYYIELVPNETAECEHIITFFTDSTVLQPHYSFWFGAPLVETKTAIGTSFIVRITKPNTNSYLVRVAPPYGIPAKRAWVHTVKVDQISQQGTKNVTSKRMCVTFPGRTTSSVAQYISTTSSSIEFAAYPCNALGSLASGTYAFQLTGVSWSNGTAASASYSFQGRMIATYIYAFGA